MSQKIFVNLALGRCLSLITSLSAKLVLWKPSNFLTQKQANAIHAKLQNISIPAHTPVDQLNALPINQNTTNSCRFAKNVNQVK